MGNNNKPDMTLTVDVFISGTVTNNGPPSVSAQFTQTASMPLSPNVVDPSGNIDLNNMAYDRSQYNKDTDITFNLSGQLTDQNGNPVAFSFPSVASQAVAITKNGGGSTNQLTPKIGSSPMQLIIDDEDNDSATYSYCLTVWASTPGGGQAVQLDPQIVNR